MLLLSLMQTFQLQFNTPTNLLPHTFALASRWPGLKAGKLSARREVPLVPHCWRPWTPSCPPPAPLTSPCVSPCRMSTKLEVPSSHLLWHYLARLCVISTTTLFFQRIRRWPSFSWTIFIPTSPTVLVDYKTSRFNSSLVVYLAKSANNTTVS